MFALVERGRLAMYEKTLSAAVKDTACGPFYVPGFEDALHLFEGAVTAAAGGAFILEYRCTLIETITSIPSTLLSNIDLILLRIVRPPTASNELAPYYMASLLSGLIYVRIVEVSRPSLRRKAHAFRDNVLSFIEPIYLVTLDMAALQDHVMTSLLKEETVLLEERGEAERQEDEKRDADRVERALKVGWRTAMRSGGKSTVEDLESDRLIAIDEALQAGWDAARRHKG